MTETGPCLPSLGEPCGSCHRCTEQLANQYDEFYGGKAAPLSEVTAALHDAGREQPSDDLTPEEQQLLSRTAASPTVRRAPAACHGAGADV